MQPVCEAHHPAVWHVSERTPAEHLQMNHDSNSTIWVSCCIHIHEAVTLTVVSNTVHFKQLSFTQNIAHN